MVLSSGPFEILFLTNFSDYCYQVIPSIAQLVDKLPVRLTLMHVYDPVRTTAAQAAEPLRSFFPEADRYRVCSRVVVAGPVVEAVRRHVAERPVHLIVAPASDPIGIPRIGDRSLRAQLIDACGVPLWTMGRGLQQGRLPQPVRNVACWLDFHADRHRHLAFAVEFARGLGARLHVLRGLPAVDEGLLMPPGHPDRALHPDHAAEELAAMCDRASIDADVHVGQGDGRRTMIQLLARCDADLVFLRSEERLVSRWLGLGVGLRLGDRTPCPSIHISDRPRVPAWRLEPARRPRPHAADRGGGDRGEAPRDVAVQDALASEAVSVGERVSVGRGRASIALSNLAEIGLV